jgi:hypothetical protein
MSKKMGGVDVFDIEQFPNFHSYYGIDKDTRDISIFVIHSSRNDIVEYIEYLESLRGMIGFNNVNYDYPMIHYILQNKNKLIKMDANTLNKHLYNESQRIINTKWSSVAEWNVKIPQMDLFLLNHYDNPAKSSSLKWLEFTQRWHKVQDLPFHHTHIVTDEEVESIIEYNGNDTEFTLQLYLDCQEAVKFRMNISKKLGKNVMNYSDVKIGEYINQITYEKLSGRDYKEFKNDRTIDSVFYLKDIIPDSIKFKTKYMQDFLEDLRLKSFTSTKDDDKDPSPIDTILTLGDIHIKFAKGGLHSEDEARIVSCKPNWKLKEKDIASMYPWGIISDGIYPRHLGPDWNKGIKQSFDYRTFTLKPQLKKLKYGSSEYESIDSEQEVYKLSMNGGGFGKLGSAYSWQCDYLGKYKVTIGGQLKLLMLIEDFFMAGIDIISVNTDGVVVHYPEDKEPIVTKIHNDWEKLTTFILEDTSYSKIIFSNVNHYIAIIIDEQSKKVIKHKFKGHYELDKPAHKNNSQRIVTIALAEYFINGVAPRDVIRNIGYEFTNSKGKLEKTTVYDYCIGVKKAKNQLYHYVKKGGTLAISDKVIRYYIADNRNKLFKEYTEKSTDYEKKLEAVSKGWNVELFMDYEDRDDYNINYIYYEQECKKIIDPIEKKYQSIKCW